MVNPLLAQTRAAWRAAAGIAAMVVAATACWWLTVQMSVDFYAELTTITATAYSETLWADASFAMLLAMWGVMMAAMMLPSFLPTALLFRRLLARKSSAKDGDGGGLLAFICGYVAIWLAFSGVMAGAQFWLTAADALRVDMALESSVAGAILLLAAGGWQFSALKFSCLKGCRHPAFFFLLHWRGGARGALRMGAHNGLLCVGCCWLLMLLLWVGGVMHLGWIAALTAYVAVEKLLPVNPLWLARTTGALLILAGGWQLAAAVAA